MPPRSPNLEVLCRACRVAREPESRDGKRKFSFAAHPADLAALCDCARRFQNAPVWIFDSFDRTILDQGFCTWRFLLLGAGGLARWHHQRVTPQPSPPQSKLP